MLAGHVAPLLAAGGGRAVHASAAVRLLLAGGAPPREPRLRHAATTPVQLQLRALLRQLQPPGAPTEQALLLRAAVTAPAPSALFEQYSAARKELKGSGLAKQRVAAVLAPVQLALLAAAAADARAWAPHAELLEKLAGDVAQGGHATREHGRAFAAAVVGVLEAPGGCSMDAIDLDRVAMLVDKSTTAAAGSLPLDWWDRLHVVAAVAGAPAVQPQTLSRCLGVAASTALVEHLRPLAAQPPSGPSGSSVVAPMSAHLAAAAAPPPPPPPPPLAPPACSALAKTYTALLGPAIARHVSANRQMAHAAAATGARAACEEPADSADRTEPTDHEEPAAAGGSQPAAAAAAGSDGLLLEKARVRAMHKAVKHVATLLTKETAQALLRAEHVVAAEHARRAAVAGADAGSAGAAAPSDAELALQDLARFPLGRFPHSERHAVMLDFVTTCAAVASAMGADSSDGAASALAEAASPLAAAASAVEAAGPQAASTAVDGGTQQPEQQPPLAPWLSARRVAAVAATQLAASLAAIPTIDARGQAALLRTRSASRAICLMVAAQAAAGDRLSSGSGFHLLMRTFHKSGAGGGSGGGQGGDGGGGAPAKLVDAGGPPQGGGAAAGVDAVERPEESSSAAVAAAAPPLPPPTSSHYYSGDAIVRHFTAHAARAYAASLEAAADASSAALAAAPRASGDGSDDSTRGNDAPPRRAAAFVRRAMLPHMDAVAGSARGLAGELLAWLRAAQAEAQRAREATAAAGGWAPDESPASSRASTTAWPALATHPAVVDALAHCMAAQGGACDALARLLATHPGTAVSSSPSAHLHVPAAEVILRGGVRLADVLRRRAISATIAAAAEPALPQLGRGGAPTAPLLQLSAPGRGARAAGHAPDRSRPSSQAHAALPPPATCSDELVASAAPLRAPTGDPAVDELAALEAVAVAPLLAVLARVRSLATTTPQVHVAWAPVWDAAMAAAVRSGSAAVVTTYVAELMAGGLRVTPAGGLAALAAARARAELLDAAASRRGTGGGGGGGSGWWGDSSSSSSSYRADDAAPPPRATAGAAKPTAAAAAAAAGPKQQPPPPRAPTPHIILPASGWRALLADALRVTLPPAATLLGAVLPPVVLQHHPLSVAMGVPRPHGAAAAPAA